MYSIINLGCVVKRIGEIPSWLLICLFLNHWKDHLVAIGRSASAFAAVGGYVEARHANSPSVKGSYLLAGIALQGMYIRGTPYERT